MPAHDRPKSPAIPDTPAIPATVVDLGSATVYNCAAPHPAAVTSATPTTPYLSCTQQHATLVAPYRTQHSSVLVTSPCRALALLTQHLTTDLPSGALAHPRPRSPSVRHTPCPANHSSDPSPHAIQPPPCSLPPRSPSTTQAPAPTAGAKPPRPQLPLRQPHPTQAPQATATVVAAARVQVVSVFLLPPLTSLYAGRLFPIAALSLRGYPLRPRRQAHCFAAPGVRRRHKKKPRWVHGRRSTGVLGRQCCRARRPHPLNAVLASCPWQPYIVRPLVHGNRTLYGLLSMATVRCTASCAWPAP